MTQDVCACGCGAIPPLANKTVRKLGWIKGKPRPLVPGHRRSRNQPLSQVGDKELFEYALQASSLKQIKIHFGLPLRGGFHSKLRQRLAKLGIDPNEIARRGRKPSIQYILGS